MRISALLLMKDLTFLFLLYPSLLLLLDLNRHDLAALRIKMSGYRFNLSIGRYIFKWGTICNSAEISSTQLNVFIVDIDFILGLIRLILQSDLPLLCHQFKLILF